MPRTTWHCHVAISLDGMIARPDGAFDWLERYPAEDFGIEAFMAGVDAILMGRGSYDAMNGMGEWPYPGRPATVVTSRPPDAAPPGVEFRAGPLDAVVEEIESRGTRRGWVFGGGQLLRGMLAIGKLDVLEMAVIPIVLGQGIPLFPPGTKETPLRLRHCEARAGGALHLVYDLPRA
jgi:dihydrofolate reductase